MSTKEETAVPKNLLEESFSEKYLNVYFNELETFYGIDVAVETALEKKSIKDSISKYRSIPSQVNDLDINIAILKSVVLNNTNNLYVRYIKEKINNSKIEELIEDMEINVHLKRALVKLFAENTLTPPGKKYERINNKDEAIDGLTVLHSYKLEQEKKKRIKILSKIKKEQVI